MIDLCAITEHEARANDTSYIKKNSTAWVDYYEKMTKLRKVQKHLARCFCTTYFPWAIKYPGGDNISEEIVTLGDQIS